MPRKKQEVNRREALLSELASECESPEEFMDLLSDLKKSLLEKALDAEMNHHLGYRKHQSSGRGSGNSRNGLSGDRFYERRIGVDLVLLKPEGPYLRDCRRE